MLSNSYQNHINYKTEKVDKQFIKAGELILKSECVSIMKANTNCYWQQIGTIDIIIIATCTIFHPCLDMSTIKYVEEIPRGLCNRNRRGMMYKDIQFVYLM